MAAENIVSIIVKALDQTGPGFAETKASATEAGTSLDGYSAAVDKASAANTKFAASQNELKAAAAQVADLEKSETASTDELAAAQSRLMEASLKAAAARKEMASAEEDVAAKTKVAEAEQVDAGVASKGFGDTALAAGASLQKFGTIGGLAIAGVGYESIKMGMSFQQAMTQLVTQAGVPQREMGTLQQGVLSLAGSVGFSPDSLAEATYHVASNMASLGATAPQMLNVVKIAAEGAKVGGADLVDVTNALGAAIASNITGVQNYSQAMGALNAVVGAGDMKMQDLAEALGTGLLASVKGYGVTLNEVGAALATFGDNNIRGAKAGTELRMAVQAMAVPAATGKAALASMGLTATTLATDMSSKGGLQYAINDLAEHMRKAGYTGSQVGSVLTEAFGKKAGSGINILVDQVDRFNSKFKVLDEGAKGFGSAWQKTQENLKQQWDELKGTFEALMTSLGETLIPVLSKIAGFLLKNKGAIEALAPVVMAVVTAFTIWAGIMKVIDILSDMNPWVIIIMLIIAAVVLLIEHWKAVKTVLEDVGHFFEQVGHDIEHVFDDIKHAVADAVDAVRETFVRMGHDVESAVDAVVSFIRDHWKLLAAIFLGPLGLIIDALATHWAAVKHGFEDAWNAVSGIVKTALDAIKGFIMPVVSYLENLFTAAWNQVESIFKAAWNYISSVVTAGVDQAKTILNWFAGLAKLLAGWWQDAVNEVSSWIDKLISFVEGIPGRINSALGGLPAMLFNAGVNAIKSLINGITSMIGDVASTVSNIASKVAGFFGLSPAKEGPLSAGGAPWIRGQHLVQDIAGGMRSQMGMLAGTAGAMAAIAGGGHVFTSGGQTEISGGNVGVGGGMQLQVMSGGGTAFEQFMVQALRNYVRVRGGSVQSALGH